MRTRHSIGRGEGAGLNVVIRQSGFFSNRRPPHRHHRLPLRVALPAAQPRFEVEHRGVGRERLSPDPELVRRQQLRVPARRALDLDEVARAEVLNASFKERLYRCPSLFVNCSPGENPKIGAAVKRVLGVGSGRTPQNRRAPMGRTKRAGSPVPSSV